MTPLAQRTMRSTRLREAHRRDPDLRFGAGRDQLTQVFRLACAWPTARNRTRLRALLADSDRMELILRNPDFGTAIAMVDAINKYAAEGLAGVAREISTAWS